MALDRANAAGQLSPAALLIQDLNEPEMILRLEVNDVADVRRRGALCLLRVSQACARRTDGFALAGQPISIERTHAELFDKESRGVFHLPEPIVERSKNRRQ